MVGGKVAQQGGCYRCHSCDGESDLAELPGLQEGIDAERKENDDPVLLHEEGGGGEEAQPEVAVTAVAVEEEAKEIQEKYGGKGPGHVDAEADEIAAGQEVEQQGR